MTPDTSEFEFKTREQGSKKSTNSRLFLKEDALLVFILRMILLTRKILPR